MAVERDPYQVLGLSRGASLEDVKRAYRGLAKANHPDAAGPAALPRFLAIQAAYESIAGGGSTRPGGARSASRPSSADPDRAGATHRAYGARGRRPRPGPTPGGFAGWAAGGAPPSGAAGGTDRGGSAADGTGRSGGGASARSAGSNAGRTAGGGPAAGGATSPGGAGASAGAAGSGGATASAAAASGRPDASGAASPGGAGTSGGPATSAGASGAAATGRSDASGAAGSGRPDASGAASSAPGQPAGAGSGPRAGSSAGSTTGPDRFTEPDPTEDGDTGAGASAPPGADAARRRRNKATLGSTSYDGVDATPFEPDWGGASWYGTTSGTYWTLNPKEYADPRKHGPEYQARARRWNRARPAEETNGTGQAPDTASHGGLGPEGIAAAAPGADRPSSRSGPMHTTTSWWESTSGPADPPSDEASGRGHPTRPPGGRRPPSQATQGQATAGATAATSAKPASDPPDVGRAFSDLVRALLDEGTGGTRGRIVRAVVGWLPIAFGIGWLAGEMTGCGRFAATCDGATDPFVVGLQIAILALLLAVPLLASVTTMATITLLAVASFVALVLSATGSAADDGSRRVTLGIVLLLSWLAGVVIAGARRARATAAASAPPARPLS